jgi:hypothetical protein
MIRKVKSKSKVKSQKSKGKSAYDYGACAGFTFDFCLLTFDF